MAVAGGTIPVVRVGKAGDVYTASYQDDGTGGGTGLISASYQSPGDASPSGPQYLCDPHYDPIPLTAAGGFALDQLAEGAARWILVLVVAGESDYSEWLSGDDGGIGGRAPTFTRIGTLASVPTGPTVTPGGAGFPTYATLDGNSDGG